MNDLIQKIRKGAIEKYTYSDCDGDNNHGIRLNEEKFAELIIAESVYIARLVFPNGNHEFETTLKDHFGMA